MKKILFLFTILLLSVSHFLRSAPLDAETATSALKLDEYLSGQVEISNLDNKKILVNILSKLPELKMQEFKNFIEVPFHGKLIRAIYPKEEKNPEIYTKFILNPRPLLKEGRLKLIKKIDEKLQITTLIFLEDLIKSNEYAKAEENPERYKIDSARYERLLNHFYYRLNDFKGSELSFALEKMLDSKGIKIMQAVNKTMIAFLKESQKSTVKNESK